MRRNHWFQKLAVIVLILALTGGMGMLFATRAAKRSVNPFLERDPESSRMYQEEAASLSVDSPDFPPDETSTSLPPEEPPEEEEEEPDTPRPTPSEIPAEPSVTPDPAPENELFSPVPPIEDAAETDLADPGETGPLGGMDPAAQESSPDAAGGDLNQPERQPDDTTSDNPVELLDPQDLAEGPDGVGDQIRETDVVYFTTNIINGSTITFRELPVEVVHKVDYLAVTSFSAEVNGVPVQFDGVLLLEEGQNTIRFTALYADQEGHEIEVSKTYTVYVELARPAITTDLYDRVINQKSLRFTAYASAGGVRIPLYTYVNGIEIGSSGNTWQASLEEGDNEIRLYAASDDGEAELVFHIFVELPDELQFTTDLYDHEVDNSDFEFYAALTGGTSSALLTVTANGQTLSGSDGMYRVQLARGNNFIRLKAQDVDGAEFWQEFVIAYHNYVVRESWEADDTMPVIRTNVTDGMEMSGSLYTLQVRGESASGERIFGDHLTVELNGMILEDQSEDNNATFYLLELTGGSNSLVVTVWDYEDRYTIYRYTLNYTEAEEGTAIGTVTVSVEASTVGLGYLVPPTQVNIYQGENVVYPVLRALEMNGYEYNYQGNISNGFYLAHIIREGITDGYHIPEDLEDAINSEGLYWTHTYSTGSLGEYDFTQGSGWLYSLNGYSMPDMAKVYPNDGDEVRVRYTLAYGKDVGMGSSGVNFFKEW